MLKIQGSTYSIPLVPLLIFNCFLYSLSSVLAPYESQILDCSSVGTDPNISNCSHFKKETEGVDHQETTKTTAGVNYYRRNIEQAITHSSKNCSSSNDGTILCEPVLGDQRKPIEIYIESPDIDILAVKESQLHEAKAIAGGPIRIQCRFKVLVATPDQDLKFKLNWSRRSSAVHDGHKQTDSPPSEEKISTRSSRDSSSRRLWTTELDKDGGLELNVNYIDRSDSGEYFCRAHRDEGSNEQLLDEQQLRLVVVEREGQQKQQQQKPTIENNLDPTNNELINYSQETLNKLLPSLKVIPEFSQLALGDSIELACVTSGLDPDPVIEQRQQQQQQLDIIQLFEKRPFEWSFEPPISRPGDTSSRVGPITRRHHNLPPNTRATGNLLSITSMTLEHVGLYKCTHNLFNYNLLVEATGELALRPDVDSAPLVFLEPSLLRLPANGSTIVQCESTGFPVPQIEWYRVGEEIVPTNNSENNQQTNSTTTDQLDGSATRSATSLRPRGENVANIVGIDVIELPAQEALVYCHLNGCSSAARRHQITAISQVRVSKALAHHQGQYVCKASNKHGTNQASMMVDVEFKLAPKVRIADELRRQTIVLPANELATQLTMMTSQAHDMNAKGHNHSSRYQPPSVTFKCSIEAGRPKPRLRWLRVATSSALALASGGGGGGGLDKRLTKMMTASSAGYHRGHLGAMMQTHGGTAAQLDDVENLDIYDLTKVSSATSRVSTWFEANGSTLVLSLSTVSIDDEGDYICLGENDLGRHTAVAHLTIRKPASVRILQSSPKIAQPNESFQFDCLSSGHPAPIDIEWSRSDMGAFFALISRHAQSGESERAVLKFDRITSDEAGEYTCVARDPLNSSVILRDTIMLVVEDKSLGDYNEWSSSSSSSSMWDKSSQQQQLPKLMVRPTRVMAPINSNVTLDCLAISGLQPTIVEWLAPAKVVVAIGDELHRTNQLAGSGNLNNQDSVSIRPYYRSSNIRGASLRHGPLRAGPGSDQLMQFGSKLRIFNISKSHEGVYQCRGRNKIGIENAPALIKVVDNRAPPEVSPTWPNAGSKGGADSMSISSDAGSNNGTSNSEDRSALQTKTKVAKLGTNIELRCQVNGMAEQPATSWSREGKELPSSSVQIEHNLWIQNLTNDDEGLYLCSARSTEPNRVIQARINLLVRSGGGGQLASEQQQLRKLMNLNAKIVASKTNLNIGDSVTLECILSVHSPSINHTELGHSHLDSQLVDLDELENQIVWTNLHSGESLFQDNVYIQNNLLIIYDLREKNSATYRCNYNDLTQHTDYKLQVASSPNRNKNESLASDSAQDGYSAFSMNSDLVQQFDLQLQAHNNNGQRRRVFVKQVAHGSRVQLECPLSGPAGSLGAQTDFHWISKQVSTSAGYLNQTTNNSNNNKQQPQPQQQQQQLLVFESVTPREAGLYRCQSISGANQSDDVIVRVEQVAARFNQRPVSFVSLPAIANADYQLEIEMKFLPEKDSGLMLFSGGLSGLQRATSSSGGGNANNSIQVSDYISLGMNRGHLEFRFELGDGETLLRSNQSLALNQWHRVIIERNRRDASMYLDGQQPVSNTTIGKFFNLNLDSVLYVGGHQLLLNYPSNGNSNSNNNRNDNKQVRLNGYLNGFSGCISLLRINRRELDLMARNRSASIGVYECDKSECLLTKEFCSYPNGVCQIDRSAGYRQQSSTSDANIRQLQSEVQADIRCICLPGYSGSNCSSESTQTQISLDQNLTSTGAQQNKHVDDPSLSHVNNNCNQNSGCNLTGTLQCHQVSSTSTECNCKIGFLGPLCEQPANFSDIKTSVGFRGNSFLRLRLPSSSLSELEQQQNISFKFGTKSSVGLILYMGPASFELYQPRGQNKPQQQQQQSLPPPPNSIHLGPTNNNNINNSTTNNSNQSIGRQPSKSIIANQLARLSGGRVADFLAIALVDGHLELTYELGSGLAVIRSSRRLNDGQWHRVQVSRRGKWAKLVIDDALKYEGSSPGKMTMLNVADEIHLGGLYLASDSQHPQMGSNFNLLRQFQGCLSHLQLNTLGPVNLLDTEPGVSQLDGGQNIVPCGELANVLNSGLDSKEPTNLVAPGSVQDTMNINSTIRSTSTRRPPVQSSSEDENDDSD